MINSNRLFFICFKTFVMLWTKNCWEKIKNNEHCSMIMLFTALRFPYVILCPSWMTVQTSKGKVPHIYKELFRRIMRFEYENLLLVKSTQNKVASNIAITKHKNASQTNHKRHRIISSFSQVIFLHLIIHVSLGFNIY